MSIELDLYTGTLIYKDIEFNFVFDHEKLNLIPPIDKKREVYMWFMKYISENTYTFGDPVYIEETLIGRCNENGHRIIFIPEQSSIGRYNSVLSVNIAAYIIENYEREWIDRIGFTSQEIDCIFPTTQALKKIEFADNGTISVETKDFSKTTSQKQEFFVDDKKVLVNFDISRKSSGKIGDPPLELHSEMFFEFEKTKDYNFILQLWYIAKCFIQYLCYRKNVNLSTINLSAPYANGNHEKFATLFIVNTDINNESEALEGRRYIKQEYINGREGKILNDISKGKIYMRHIPESYEKGIEIDAARFVMITAAFEWTFNKIYPDGVYKKAKSIEAEKDVIAQITELVDSSTGKRKEIYKFLKKSVQFESLKSKIEQIGRDYESIVGIFGKRLYSLNGEVLKYSEMGERISAQRNNYAHGKLDKEFIGASLLDLVYLEYIIYAMQLKEYGVEDILIQRAINDLFGCSMMI